MSDDNKFWISINAIIGATLVSIIFLSLSYWKDHNRKIVEMVAGGTDPVEAICALQNDYGKMPVCIILAATKRAD